VSSFFPSRHDKPPSPEAKGVCTTHSMVELRGLEPLTF
jgi:hypothetical protein